MLGARSADRDPVPAGVAAVALAPHRGGWSQALFPFRPAVLRNLAWCDAAIVRGYWLAFWALLTAALLRKRVRVVDFHGFVHAEQRHDRRLWRSRTTLPLEHAGLRLASAIAAVSPAIARDLPARFRPRSLVLENGVDPAPFGAGRAAFTRDELVRRFGLREGAAVFAVVARYGPWLNLDDVVSAGAQIRGRAEILVIGDGDGVARARARAAAAGAANVHFVGRQPHAVVASALTELCRGCICPYSADWVHAQVEDFFASRKVKEYMAAGRAILVSDVKGRGRFLVDGETCLLYPAGDGAALAARMAALIDDPSLAARLGDAARRAAEAFTWNSVYRASGLSARLRRKESRP